MLRFSVKEKRAAAVLLLFFFLFTFSVYVGYAEASLIGYRVTEIKNLKAQKSGSSVILTWRFRCTNSLLVVAEYLADPMKVIRIHNGKEKVLTTIPVPEKDGYFEQRYTDKNPPKGEVTYRVSTVNKLGKGVSQSVTINTKEAAEGETSTSSGGESSEQLGTMEKPDWSERLASYLIGAPARWLLKVMGLYDPVDLIFGNYVVENPREVSKGRTEMSAETYYASQGDFKEVGALPYFNTFTEKEWNALNEFYGKMNQFVPIELVVVVVLMGLAYWYASTIPESKISLRTCFAGLLIAMFLLRIGGLLFAFLFDLNKLIVGQFYSIVQDKIADGTSFLTAFISVNQDGYLGAAILFVVSVFSIAVINFQYVMRKIVIALLIVLLPLVAVISVLKREVLGTWFRELISNIFLQSAHAAVLAFLIALGTAGGSSRGSIATTSEFWFSLVALLCLPTIAGLVRRIIGAETFGGFMGSFASGLGLSSLFVIGRILGGAGRIRHELPEKAGGVGAAAKEASAEGRMPVPALSKAAGFTLGAVGALAGGMSMGPVGMAAGGVAGTKIAGLFTDVASSVSSFYSKAKTEGITTALGFSDKLQVFDPESMRQAGQTVFGDNVIGKAAGSALAASSHLARLGGVALPHEVEAVEGAKNHIRSAQESIPVLQKNLEDLSSQRAAAKLEYDRAKMLYGPGSENYAEAKKVIDKAGGYEEAQKLVSSYYKEVEEGRARVERLSRKLAGIPKPGSPESRRTAEQLFEARRALEKLEQVRPGVQRIEKAIETVDNAEIYKKAKAEYEQVSAQEAEARLNLIEAEKAAARESLKEYFEKIRAEFPKQEDQGSGVFLRYFNKDRN
ncbi:MAG TPA: hypothetical protein DEA47_01065 [Peptococcaceae bacterium]|nr:MAG: hypothetical protein XD50_0275 [Clostridia bacterium 41_269]HBT19954.1 hypothetical protein [Peptococcaceae bacterium]